MGKLMELADAYAHAVWGESDEKHEARAALQAEIEKVEAENAKLHSALEDILFNVEDAMRNEVQPYEVEMAAKRARAALGENDAD